MSLEDLSNEDNVYFINGAPPLSKPRRDWINMNDQERLDYVWATYGKDITPNKLKKIDFTAYRHLLNRGLTCNLKEGKK